VPPLRFIAAFAVSALAAAAGVAGINGLVDPLGVVPASPVLRGMNAEKVTRFNNDRSYKPLDLLSVRPRTVVLGTSRILQAFDPSTLSGTAYGPAYNYGLAGGDLDELESHFEKFVARTPSVKYVFVELFLPRAVARSQRSASGLLELLAATFFSWSALHESAETVWQNARSHAGFPTGAPVILPDGRQSFVGVSTLPKFLAYPAAFLGAHPRYDLSPWILVSMRRMREVARRRGIALTFFLSPMHAVQLYGLYATGYWPLLESWKQELAREFDVLDFSAYTTITEEPVSTEMHYWVDPHHFSRLTAQMLTERLVRGGAGAPDRFGVRLTPDRLQDELRTSRAARDAWITRNPGWVALFRLARTDGGTNSLAGVDIPGAVQCPVRVGSALLPLLASPHPSRQWIVVSDRTTLDPPIAVRVRATRPPGRDVEEACELKIGAAPETPSARSVDWRIGHSMGPPGTLRGRTIRYTVRARANAPVALNTGMVYVYDGVRTSSAPLTILSREWRTIIVEHSLSLDSSRLEVWFRLVLGHGTVRPIGGQVFFTATVDLLPAATPPPSTSRRGPSRLVVGLRAESSQVLSYRTKLKS